MSEFFGGGESDPVASAELAAHEAATTAVHGIANTAALATTSALSAEASAREDADDALGVRIDGISGGAQIGTHADRLTATPTAGLLWRESESGLIYLGDGDDWNVWKGEGAVRKSADETVNNSDTLQADDELHFPVEANEVWLITAILLIGSGASNVADFKAGWSGPSGASATWGPFTTITGFGWNAAGTTATPNAVLGLADTASIGVRAGTTTLFQAQGIFTIGATAGSLGLRWAQDVATAIDTKVLTNSLLRLQRLA